MAKQRDAGCFFKFPQGLVGHPAMTGPCYAFVAAFLTRANGPGQQCWADVVTLAKIVGKGKSAAYEARDALMRAGLLIQEPRWDKPGETAYRLAPDCWRPYVRPDKPDEQPSPVRKTGIASPENRNRQSGKPESPVRISGTDRDDPDREPHERDDDDRASSSSFVQNERKPEPDPEAGAVRIGPSEDLAAVMKAVRAVFGEPSGASPSTAEVEKATAECGAAWVLKAVETARKAEGKKGKRVAWGYVVGILNNWRTEGKGPKPAPKPVEYVAESPQLAAARPKWLEKIRERNRKGPHTAEYAEALIARYRKMPREFEELHPLKELLGAMRDLEWQDRKEGTDEKSLYDATAERWRKLRKETEEARERQKRAREQRTRGPEPSPPAEPRELTEDLDKFMQTPKAANPAPPVHGGGGGAKV